MLIICDKKWGGNMIPIRPGPYMETIAYYGSSIEEAERVYEKVLYKRDNGITLPLNDPLGLGKDSVMKIFEVYRNYDLNVNIPWRPLMYQVRIRGILIK